MARDYGREYASYHGKPEQKKRRAARNKARRLAIREHGEAAVRGKDVHHRDYNPQNNRPSNLAIRSVSANRSDQPGKGKKKK